MKRLILFVVLFAAANEIVLAQDMPVPIKLQVAMFKKIFNYNVTLQSKGVKLAVVYGDARIKDELIDGFKQFGLFPTAVSATDIEKQIANYNVVYVTPGCGSLKSLTDKHKVFSISGLSSLAEKGEISIAIGVEGGKPKILINKKKIESEGQELSPDLLKIAKVL